MLRSSFQHMAKHISTFKVKFHPLLKFRSEPGYETKTCGLIDSKMRLDTRFHVASLLARATSSSREVFTLALQKVGIGFDI